MAVSIRRLVKTGNSLVISIPAELRRELELHRGDQVALWSEGAARIIIQKLDEAAVRTSATKHATLVNNE